MNGNGHENKYQAMSYVIGVYDVVLDCWMSTFRDYFQVIQNHMNPFSLFSCFHVFEYKD